MLYHYTTKEGLYGILNSKKFWLVSSSEMSDITDRFYGNLFSTVALLKSEDEDIKLLRDNLTEQDILDVNMQTFDASFYSLSFCDNSNNEYLWENYAGEYSGFAIGVDENYFLESIKKIVNEYYEKTDYEDVPHQILELRKVYYKTPNNDYVKIVKMLKPDEYVLKNNKNAYKDWFLFSLSILAGIVKAKKYEPEQEIRILFQNRYSKEYENKHPIQLLFSFGKDKLLTALGLSGEPVVAITNSPKTKKRFELNLTTFFNSRLIPIIFVGDKCQTEYSIIKNKIIECGLLGTKILNREGKEL